MASEIFKTIVKEKVDNFLYTFEQESNSLFKKNNRLFHSGEFGMYREECLKALLRSILSLDYKVGDGFLINGDNGVGTQCDIVIYNSKASPISNNGIAKFYPVEIVSGIGEVKSNLSKTTLQEGLLKLARNKILFKNRDRVSADKTKKALCQHLPISFLICQKIDGIDSINEKFFEDLYTEIPSQFQHNIILSLEDGICCYEIDTKKFDLNYTSKKATYTFPMINNLKLKRRFVKSKKEDPYYHIYIFLSKIYDDVNYIEKYEFPILEYLNINNSEFENILKQ